MHRTCTGERQRADVDRYPSTETPTPLAQAQADGGGDLGGPRGGLLEHERAYFERGFFAAYAWMLTKGEGVLLSDAVIEHAWDHRDEGMAGDDLLPLPTQSPPPDDGVREDAKS